MRCSTPLRTQRHPDVQRASRDLARRHPSLRRNRIVDRRQRGETPGWPRRGGRGRPTRTGQRLVRRRLARGFRRLPSRTRCVHVPGRPRIQLAVRAARSDHQQQPHRQAASTGLTISRSLVTASIAIVFGGLFACGLGIVPFGRRQRLVIGVAAGDRRAGGRLGDAARGRATRPDDHSTSSPTVRRGGQCSTPRSESPGSSARSASV